MTKKDLIATIMVGLVTVTAAYAADVPDASTPAPKPSKSARKSATSRQAEISLKERKAKQDHVAEPAAVASPPQK